MSTATMQPPVVPPRPARNQDKGENPATTAASLPKVPPRPIKYRAMSPSNPERFAPSPLNESFLSKSPKATRASPPNGNGFRPDPIARPSSVSMPSLGEEGNEYAVVEELSSSPEQTHTRTVGEDVKLHAPKPSLPAQSSKQRIAAVTRTDSDRAASFGIGKPSSDEPSTGRSSTRKKSSVSQTSDSESHTESGQGIPEIGQRVPMNPFAGDIQAPSPAPVSNIAEGLKSGRHHTRKTSARGFEDLPPGSYGLHGHGVTSTDRLDKAYYEKHPEVLYRERSVQLHDRQNDFAMSSTELNKIVRETASRGSGLATGASFGTPSEELGYQAHEEYAARISSPRPKSEHRLSATIVPQAPKTPELSVTEPQNEEEEVDTIHIDDSAAARRRSYVRFGGDVTPPEGGEEAEYTAPILAADEVAKDPSPYELQPAVEPPASRRGSAYEMEQPPSRPTSRPASLYREITRESISTPLEDVREYDPLFPEDAKDAKEAKDEAPAEPARKRRHQFPSKDVWEDAPASVHYEAEVSTPDGQQEALKPVSKSPEARAETPAAAFARHQEELAEKESRGDPEAFLSREQKIAAQPKPKWLPPQSSVAPEVRPTMRHRFPSQDVWEDTPDSLLHETTVGGPQEEEQEDETKEEPAADSKPQVPVRPQKKLTDPTTGKPAVPERPKPKAVPAEEKASSPVEGAEKPKPQVPARPSKSLHSGSESKELDASSKPKPAVPARLGGKIAALQAGFMSDLNNRLKLGMQPPKKQEPVEPEAAEEKVEKAPLSDARKGRARGPQRRAPGTSPAPAAGLAETKTEAKVEAQPAVPSLSFSFAATSWSIDPEDGVLSIKAEDVPAEGVAKEATAAESPEPAPKAAEDVVAEPATAAPPTVEAPVEEETKALASNMAGDTIVEATIEKEEGDKVDVEDVEEVAKEKE